MGRPIRHTPDEWKAIEKQKAFWQGVTALVALIFVLVIVAALIIKVGTQVAAINHPAGILFLIIFLGTVTLMVGMAFR